METSIKLIKIINTTQDSAEESKLISKRFRRNLISKSLLRRQFVISFLIVLLVSISITTVFAANKCPTGISITTGAGGQTLCKGATPTAIVATVTFNSGTIATNMSYTWYYNTTNSTNTSTATQVQTLATTTGTTTNTLTAGNISTATPGTYYYFCVLTSVSGCGGPYTTSTVLITVNTIAPTAGNNGPVCAGTTLSLTASTVTGATYAWSGPNSYSSAVQNPTVSTSATSAMAGTYSVTATISGCNSSAGTTSVSVNIKSANPTSATSGSGTICNGGSTTLTLNGGGGGTGEAVKWYTGSCGGTLAATGNGATVSPTTTTTYYGRYEDGSPCSYNSTCATVTVTVNATPSAPTTSNNGPVCAGTTLSLTASTISGATYTWAGPNSFTSSSQNPTVSTSATAAMTGTYSVSATVNGCSSTGGTTAATVNVESGNPTSATTGAGTICNGGSTTLTLNGGGGGTSETVKWYTGSCGGTLAATGNGATVSPTTTTTYYGRYEDGSPCSYNTTCATVTVTVNPIPPAPTAGNNGPVCAGSMLSLTASTVSGAIYAWTGPNSFTSTTQNPTVSSSATTAMTGTYSVVVRVNGCISSPATTTATVNPVPANNTGGNQSICSGTGETIGLANNGDTYSWNPSTGLSSSTLSNPYANPTVTTTYTLTETITATGCSASNSITVTVNPVPAITISTNWCGNGGQVQLSSNTFSSYLWSTGATTQSISVNLAGTYKLTATNSYGCTGTDTLQVASEHVINGNFSAGNTNFTSAYNYHPGFYCSSCTDPDTTGLYPENRYAIGTNANNYHPNFFGESYTNPGVNNFMIVNGNTTTVPVPVWSETINLNPYTTYYFSAYAMSLNNAGNYAQLWFAVNGVQVGTTLQLGAGATSTSGPFIWTRFYGTWYTGSATSATLLIEDYQTAAAGNDFALDNISCSTFSSLPLNIAPSGGPFCIGSTLNLNSNVTGGDAPLTYSWSGPNSFTSTAQNPSISNATSAMAGTYSLTVTDSHGCIVEGSADVTTNSTPTLTAAVSSSPVCNGSSINLTSTGSSYTGVLFYENFNPPNPAWTTINNSTGGPANAAWALEPANYQYSGTTFTSNDNSQFYLTNSNSQGSGGTTATILQSPLINTTGYTTLSLVFYQYFHYSSGSTAKIDVSTDGMNWTNVASYTSTQGTSTAFAQTTISLSSYVGNGTFYFRFNFSATDDYYWAIDNITISGTTTNYNYTWSSIPSGFSSSVQNPTGVTPTVNTTYTVSYSYADNGCSNSATASVVVNQLPAITTQPSSPSAVCSGTGTPSFTVAATGAGTLSYQWQQYTVSWANITNGGVYSGATTTTLTITNPTYIMNGYTYRCIVSGTCSPAATSNGAAMLTVNPIPTATINGTTSVCQNTTSPNITFTGSGGTSPYTFTYKINSGSNLQVSTTSGNSVTVSAPTSTTGSFVYTLLSLTDNNGCSQTQSGSATVTVNSYPTATITPAGSTTFCAGSNVILNANTGTGLSYQWMNGSGNIAGATTSTYTATTANNYTVIVTQNSCSQTSNSTTVTVNSYPTATITPVGSTTFCTGGNVVLNANTGAGLSYQWMNGSGNIAGATTSTYTAATANNYTVVVTQNTCSTTSSPATVTINSYPTATITPVGSTTFCAGGNVILNANTGAGLNYQWMNGSGNIAGATTSTYTATNANNYTVVVTQNSCSQTSNSTTVIVNSYPTATITPVGSTTFCAGGNVVLNTNTGAGLTYQWMNGSGNIAGATTITYTASIANNYTVVVTQNSCSQTSVTTTVTVNSYPTATITPLGSITFCAGGNVVLNANTGSGLSYQWMNGSGNIAGATTSTYTATTANNYTVVVTQNSCSQTSIPTTVTVNSYPTATITPVGSTTFCTGGNVVLNANTGAGLSYQWMNGSGNIAGATTSTYTASIANNYTVVVTQNSCSQTSGTTTVTVNSYPTATITPLGSTTFCAGGNVGLNANTGSGLSYQWMNGSGNIAGATTSTYTATTANNYTVVVTQNSCSQTSSPTTVTVNSYPTATITPVGSTTFCTGGNVELNSNTGTGFSYQWMNGSGNITGATTSTYTASIANNYTIVVTQNSCSQTSSPATVTLNPIPTATISGTTSVCQNASQPNITFTGGTSGATPYTFTYKINSGTNQQVTTTSGNSVTVAVPTGTTGSFVYSLVSVYDNNGCSQLQSGSATVTVNPLPTARINGTTSVCQNASQPGIIFSGATSGATPYTFTYKINSGSNQQVTTTSGSSITIYAPTNTAGSFVYTLLSVSDNNGCSQAQSGSATITVNPLPTATINGTTSVCQNASQPNLTFTGGISGATPYTFTYNINSGSNLQVSTTSGNSVTVAVPTGTIGTYIYSLVTVSDNNGCSQTQTGSATVTVNSYPTATITPVGSTTFCAGGNVVLNANTGAGLNYQWINGSGNISGATTSTYTAITANNYTIIVTQNTCSTTSSPATVTVNSYPTATITPVGSTNFCAGGNVILNANTGAGLNYQWMNGSGNITGATTSTYTATTANNYTVVVTQNSCSQTSNSTTVTVNSYPTATITPVGSTTFCAGGNVELNANTGSGLSYQWMNGSGSIAGATTSTYTAITANNYTIIVTQNTCSTTSSPATVTVNSYPTAIITPAGSTTFCAGGNVVLNANTGAGLSYQWMNGSGNIAGATTSTYTATTANNYTVVVIQNSCSQTSNSITVTVNSYPTATITPVGSTTFCAGGNVVLNANTGAGLNYQWINGSGNISGATTSTYTATTANNYTVVVTQNSCSQTSSPTTVTVNSYPTAIITPAGSTTFCAGGNVVLNANTGAGLSYQWMNGSGNIAGATTSTYTASTANNYTVIVTQNSCSQTSSQVTVTVNPLPIARINGTTSICLNASQPGIIISGTTSGAIPYTLTYNINSGTNKQITTTSGSSVTVYAPTNTAGTFVYTLISVSDNNGCSQLQSDSATVTVNSYPTATITTVSSTTFCTGENVVLNANTGTGLSYQWVNNNGNISGATTSTYTATTANNYTVIVTQNSCSQSSSPVTVTVNPIPVVTDLVTSICSGGTFTINPTGVPSGTTYQWSVPSVTPAGSITGSGAQGPGQTNISQTLTNTSSNTATAIYTVTPTSGTCPGNSFLINVTLYANLTAVISGGAPTICYGSSPGTLYATVSGGTGSYSYQWYNASSDISGETNSAYTPMNVTSNTGYFCVISGGSCQSTTSNNINITVFNNLNAGIIGNAQSVCYNSSASQLSFITAPSGGTGIYSYQWYNSTGSIYGETNSTYSPTTLTSTTNYYCLVTSENCGSVGSNNVTISVIPLPSPTITGNTEECEGNSWIQYYTEPGNSNYTWGLSNGNNILSGNGTSSIEVLWNKSGTQTVSVNYSSGGCFAASPSILNVTINSNSNILYQPYAVTTVVGRTTSFTITAVGTGLNYQWQISLNNGTSYTNISNGGSTPVYSGTQSNTLTLTGVTLDNNGNLYRCIVSASAPCSGSQISNAALLTVNPEPTSGLWDGTISTDWNTGGNWDDGVVPDSLTNVIIPASAPYQPVLYDTIGTCNNINIEPRASLTVTGTLISNGNMIISSDSTGTGAFTQSECDNVTIRGTVTVENYIASTGYHYAGSPLSNVQCNQINGFILSLYNNGVYYNPDNPAKANQFPNMWLMDEPHTHDITYDQNAWWAMPGAYPMTPARGYALNFTDSKLNISVTGPGSDMNCGEIQILLSREALSTDLVHNNVKIDEGGKFDPINGTDYGVGPTNGWHLVANPYPSPVDWNALVEGGGIGTNINYGITFFKPTTQYTGIYGTYYFNGFIKSNSGAFAPGQYIPVMQSFYIENGYNGPGDNDAILTFNNSYRNVSEAAMNTSSYKTEENYNGIPSISLRAYKSDNLTSGNLKSDKTVIMFKAQENNFGSVKFMNTDVNVPNIYAISSVSGVGIKENNFSILGLSELNDRQIIPLGFDVNTDGKYTINANEILNFPEGAHIYLEDLKNNILQDLTSNPYYTFNINIGDPDNRFFLKINLNSDNLQSDQSFEAYTFENNLIVNYNNPDNTNAKLSLINILGQTVKDNILKTSGTYRFSLEVPTGTYIVRLLTNNKVYEKKVYLQ